MYLLQHNNIVIFNDACISPFYLSVTSSVLLAKTMFRVMLASTYVCLGEFWSCWAIISFSFLAAARWNQKGAQQPFGRTASTKIHIWEPRVGATTTESTPSLTHLRFLTLRNSKKRRQKMNCFGLIWNEIAVGSINWRDDDALSSYLNAQCLKIDQKVAFYNFASEASIVYLSNSCAKNQY